MKTKILLSILISLISFLTSSAQVKIGTNSGTIDGSAILELESVSKGVLLPRLTDAQRDAISTPAIGLWIFNTTDNMPQYFDGSGWTTVADQKAFGSISLTNNGAETTFTESNAYKMATGTYTFGAETKDFVMTTNGQLKYIGVKTKHFHVSSNASVYLNGNNETMGAQIALNGVPGGIEVERKIGTQADVGAFSVHRDLSLSTGDYISFMVDNETGTYSLVFKHLYMSAVSMN